MSCLTACSPELTPVTLADCTPVFMNGGIRALAFMKCDASFSDVSGGSISDVATWEALVESGDIVFSAPILGSKPKGSTTNLRVQSCSPEIPVSRTQTINFKDFNADLETLTQYDFWINKQENFQALKLLYITCEGYVYGPFEDKTWTLDVDDVREETKESPTYIEGTITITKFAMTKPVFVDGILTLLP